MTGISYTFLLILSLSLISDLTSNSASASSTSSGDPTETTDSTDSPDSPTTADVPPTTEPSDTETSLAPDDSTTEISAATSGDPTATTVDTTLVTEDSAATPNPASTTADFTTTKDVITTTSTQSTAKTTTAKPIECKNGGTPQPNNLACICPPGFTGRVCNTVETNLVPDVIERTVDVTMEMDEAFIEDYEDPLSDAYKAFIERFNRTVVPLYVAEIHRFLRVVNIILSADNSRSQIRRRTLATLQSDPKLKVKHDVLLEVENNIESNNTYDNVVEDVNGILDELKRNPEPDFKVSNANALKTEFNVNDVCVKTTEAFPVEYRKYFETVMLEGKVTCVTPCDAAHSNWITCENSGTCEVSEDGPACYCRYTDDVWYLGEHCTLQVHKIGFYAGLGSVAALAVILVAFLTAYLVINKQTVKKNKDIKQELVKEWLDDDFEWPPQKKISNTVDRYDNPVYSPGSIDKQDNFGMYKPDFSRNQSYSQRFSPEPDIHLRNFQRDQSMRTDRPQTRTSFDI